MRCGECRVRSCGVLFGRGPLGETCPTTAERFEGGAGWSGIRKDGIGLAVGLLAVENGAPALNCTFGAAELAGDFGVGRCADQFVFGWCPFAEAQVLLVDAEGAALLPDGAKGAAGEVGDFGVGKLAQEGEFLFCPWPWFVLHALLGSELGLLESF